MPQSIVGRFAAIAQASPTATALEWHGRPWSYAQLARAVQAVHGRLASRPRGQRVALLLRNSPQYVALYYGVLTAGHVAVPLNAQERAQALARQIEHCGATLVIGAADHPEWKALAEQVTGRGVEVLSIHLVDKGTAVDTFVSELGPAEPGSASPAADSPQAAELATIIYTSGTTGRPKGVMLSHGNLASNAEGIISYLQLTTADRGLCVLPFHFSYGNSVLHSHLLAGATLVLEDNFAYPHLTLQRMQELAITGFAGVPSTFALMLGRCNLREYDLRALRYCTQAGGSMPRPLIERLHAELPGTRIFIMYGQTEATARLTYLPPSELDKRLGSVGLPVPGVQIEVRADGRVLGAGEVGEICARGPNVMQGYWGDADATAEVLRDGWLHTGDLGHRDADGYLYIDGRSVEMIKVGAFRVSPQEIEEVIAAMPSVEEVGVTAIADEMLGQAVKAVVVVRAGATLDERSVKSHCRKMLAAYKVPKKVEFASVMPRTSSGKIQRLKLA